MFKKILFFAGISTLVLIFVSRAIAATSVTNHKIVIDPGHGGSVSGSTECAGYPEKEANLDIAFRLKALLEADVAEVFMTREDDSTLSNKDRYQFANSVNGEALVSVQPITRQMARLVCTAKETKTKSLPECCTKGLLQN